MHDNITQMLQKELQGATHDKAPEKNAGKTFEENEKNAEKKQENAIESIEKPENNDLEGLSGDHESDHTSAHKGTHEGDHVEDDEIALEDKDDSTLDEEDLDEELEDYVNEIYADEFDDEDLEDPDDIPEITEDPLDAKFINKEAETDEEKEPEKVKLEDIEEKIPSSPRNNKNIEKLGFLILGRADKIKAQACSRISGQHMAEYTADDELKDTLIEAIKEYLATQEFSAPTPFGTLMIALAFWALPPVGLAFWHKYELKKQPAPQKENPSNPSTTTETVTIEVEDQEQNYSHLKEFKDGRKIFTVNKKKGTYNRTDLGTIIKNEVANEKPSPQIQEWIDQGYSNKQIRTLLYGT